MNLNHIIMERIEFILKHTTVTESLLSVGFEPFNRYYKCGDDVFKFVFAHFEGDYIKYIDLLKVN